MNFSAVDREMKISLTMKLEKLEEYLKGDVMFFFGSITPVQIQKYRFLLEELRNLIREYNTLIIQYIQRCGFPEFFHTRKYF